MARSLAGTRRAATPCAGCSHSRIRHMRRGTGPCLSVVHPVITTDVPTTPVQSHRCTCAAFIEPKGSTQ